MRRNWDQKEIDYIRDNYQSMQAKDIAKMLGRTKSAVTTKIYELGLRKNETHNMSQTRLFQIWQCMKQRCLTPKNNGYKYYGAKGVQVCPDWEESFIAFRDWSLSHGYTDELTIDRIDNKKGYSPDNCRWVTWEVQGLNMDHTNVITAFGETKSANAWAHDSRFNVSQPTILRRIKNGMTPEEALKANHIGRFTKEQVLDILSRYYISKHSIRDISKYFNTSYDGIRKIVRGLSNKDIYDYFFTKVNL